MKKASITLTLAAAALFPGCSTSRLIPVSYDACAEISWSLFCAARGYDTNDLTYPTYNEYLDTWCGSVEEENALINAGVEPY